MTFDRKDLARMFRIPQDEAEVLFEADSHSYDCKCTVCKQWWKTMGPDPETGRYGPFTKAEIEGDATEVKIEAT